MIEIIQNVRPFTSQPSVQVPIGTNVALPDFDRLPVDLELGCGTGKFALEYSILNPERQLVAVEQTVNKFAKFRRAFAEQRPTNLVPVQADGALWVDRYLPEASIERIFILYPNPYPKRKQRNLRWHYMPAMHSILRALKPNGELRFCTNLKWLLDEAAAQFSQGWNLELCGIQEVRLGSRLPLTLFEKKYLERGEICFDLRLQKPSS